MHPIRQFKNDGALIRVAILSNFDQVTKLTTGASSEGVLGEQELGEDGIAAVKIGKTGLGEELVPCVADELAVDYSKDWEAYEDLK